MLIACTGSRENAILSQSRALFDLNKEQRLEANQHQMLSNKSVDVVVVDVPGMIMDLHRTVANFPYGNCFIEVIQRPQPPSARGLSHSQLNYFSQSKY